MVEKQDDYIRPLIGQRATTNPGFPGKGGKNPIYESKYASVERAGYKYVGAPSEQSLPDIGALTQKMFESSSSTKEKQEAFVEISRINALNISNIDR